MIDYSASTPYRFNVQGSMFKVQSSKFKVRTKEAEQLHTGGHGIDGRNTEDYTVFTLFSFLTLNLEL